MGTSTMNSIPLGAADFERHLETCAECTQELASLKTLRSTLSSTQIYGKVPASLREKILTDLNAADRITQMPSRRPWRWLAIAAALVLCAFMGWQMASRQQGTDYKVC